MSDNALGRGLDSLIKKSSKPKKKSDDKKEEKTVIKSKSQKNHIKQSSKSDNKVEEIKDEVNKNPRISLWSVKSAACLRYLRKTTPEFSISNEASNLLEEAIKNKYPEIWELFDDL